MVDNTPSCGPAPDAPANLNGSTKDAAAALLYDQPVPAAPVRPVPEEPPATGTTTHEMARPSEADHPHTGLRADLATGARSALGWHGLRSTVLGVILASLAVALGIGSAVSVSLLVVGVVFLVIGVLGPRLQGRFAIEFGPNGASIDLQTQLAAAGSAWLPRPLLPTKPTVALDAPAGTGAAPALDATAAALLLDEIIAARSETIERHRTDPIPARQASERQPPGVTAGRTPVNQSRDGSLMTDKTRQKVG